MSMDEMRAAAETLRTRYFNDPQFKAKVMQDPTATLRAEGYADAIVTQVTREVMGESGDDVSGYGGCGVITCIITVGKMK